MEPTPPVSSMPNILSTSKPKEQWRLGFHQNRGELIASMDRELEKIPGVIWGFSQPIADNMEEVVSGVKGQLATKIYGDGLRVLEDKAQEIVNVMRKVQGIEDLGVFHVLGQPNENFTVDRQAAARYQINVANVHDAINTATASVSPVKPVLPAEARCGPAAVRNDSCRDPLRSACRPGAHSPHTPGWRRRSKAKVKTKDISRAVCATLVTGMMCDERALLVNQCATTMRAYIVASIKGQGLTLRANTSEYRDSLAAREQARIQVDRANHQLEQHERLHLCYPEEAEIGDAP
jgi:hypothetical protein